MVSVILQHAGPSSRLGLGLGLVARNVFTTSSQTNRYFISSAVTMGDRIEKAKLSRVEKYFGPLCYNEPHQNQFRGL